MSDDFDFAVFLDDLASKDDMNAAVSKKPVAQVRYKRAKTSRDTAARKECCWEDPASKPST